LSVKDLSDWVAKTVGECEEYWLRCGIPRVVVDEWRSELEAHIAGAIEAGKDPSAVVGSAREWAQEQARDYLKSRSPVDRTLGWAALVLLTSTLVVAPQHILHTTWNFTLGWRAIALIVVLVAVTKLLRSSVLTFLVVNSLHRKGLVMFGDYWAFGAGAIVGAFLPLNGVTHGTSGLVEWSWAYTLALLAASAIVVTVHHKRDPTRPAAGLPSVARSGRLLPVASASRSQQKKRGRIALAMALCSTLGLFALWWLGNTSPDDLRGLLFLLSASWSMLLLCLEMGDWRADGARASL
jgi:hypothetical protein